MAEIAVLVPAKAIGFLEEAAGVHSSTRLLSFILMGCVVAVVATICVYTLHKPDPSAAVIGVLGGVVTALVLNGIVAMASRTRVTTQDACAAGEADHEHDSH